MLRKYLLIGVLLGQVIAILVLIALFLQRPSGASAAVLAAPDLAPPTAPEAAPEAQIGTAGSYMWSFAAKFVCGRQPTVTLGTSGEPVVKPGNYATDINIHNYNYKQTPLRKKFLVLVKGQLVSSEPKQVGPTVTTTMTLGPDMATMDDCNNLWSTISPTGGPMPLLIGYLVILSPLDLDVDVVYTAEVPGDLTRPGTGIAEDVVRITGKRVFVP
jgi:hypothetical protein